jgi:hypothetical protein
VVAVCATRWTVGSAAALLDKLLYPLQHNADDHERCWIFEYFLSFETQLNYKNRFERKNLLANQFTFGPTAQATLIYVTE